MKRWIVIDNHVARTPTVTLATIVGVFVVGVFLIGGHYYVWWAGIIALAGWLLLFIPRFTREDRQWRTERNR